MAPSLIGPLVFVWRTVREIETSVIVPEAVLPPYSMLFAIYQNISKYDEIVEDFKQLRSERE